MPRVSGQPPSNFLDRVVRNQPTPVAGERLRGEEGVQLVELAILLPILLVLVVAVFDFGAAFNVKQELSTTARSAARFGSSEPTNDLNTGGTPNSVTSIRNMVDDSLVAAGLSDCGLLFQRGIQSTPLVWTFTAANCSAPFTLTIDRGYAFQASVGAATINVVSTHVQISYPHQWQFGRVFGLVGAGNTFTGTSQIAADAIMPNAD